MCNRSLIENIPDVVIECDADLTIVYANLAARRVLGFDPETLKDRSLIELIHPNDRAEALPVFHGIVNDARVKSVSVELRALHKKGSWRFLDAAVSGFTEESTGRRMIVMSAHDVTARKKADSRLIESKNLYRDAVEGSNDGMVLVRNGVCIKANEKFRDIFGFSSAADIDRKPIAASISSSDVQSFTEMLLEATRSGIAIRRREFDGRKKDGTKICIEVSLSRTVYRRKTALIVLVRDITRRKEAEDKARKAETALRLVFSASPAGIILIGKDMTITGINHIVTAITGYSSAELMGRGMDVLYGTEQERTRVEEIVCEDVRRCGIGATDVQWIRKNGEKRDIYLSAAAMEPGDPSSGIILAATDITARKRTENRLRESEEQYRALVEQSKYGVILVKDGAIVYSNQQCATMFGVDKPEYFIGKSAIEMIHPDDRERVRAHARRQSRGEEVSSLYEARALIRNGTYIDIEISASTTLFRGEPATFVYLRDITEHKRMEEQARLSAATLRSVMSVTPVGMALISRKRIIAWANDTLAAMSGHSIEEMTGRNMRFLYSNDEEFRRVGDVVYRAIHRGGTAVLETKMARKDGKVIDILVQGVAADPSNPAGDIVFTALDVTDKKKMYEAVRTSEEKYRNIFERAVEGIFQQDRDGRTISANPAQARMHGFSSTGEFMSAINCGSFKAFVRREDLKAYWTALKTIGRLDNFEAQCNKKDGTTMWCSMNVKRVRNISDGTPYYEGTIEDITQRKATENALRESETRYKALFRYSNDAMYLVRFRDGRLMECNPKTEEMFRCPREELIERSALDFSPPVQPSGEDSRKMMLEKVKLARSGVPQFFEWRYRRADGTLFDSDEILTHVEINKEQFCFSVVRDITDRKKAEEKLSAALSELALMNVELTKANREIVESQKKIIHQEKMASIGQLAAGVAHEINNPMGFIISNLASLDKYAQRLSAFIQAQDEAIARLSLSDKDSCNGLVDSLKKTRDSLKIDYVIGDLPDLILESRDGADRVKVIVQDLKSLARADGADYGACDINKVLDSALNMVWNELKYRITVIKDYGGIPVVKGNAGQLGQVFMNLLLNSAQAIPERGDITVRTWSKDGNVYVSIRDTGIGIPAHALHRIFEPFFTTKDVGGGTGLGLSIVYDIIKKHRGEIDVESAEGEGACFTMRIPSILTEG